jgi:hypothetical protein
MTIVAMVEMIYGSQLCGTPLAEYLHKFPTISQSFLVQSKPNLQILFLIPKYTFLTKKKRAQKKVVAAAKRCGKVVVAATSSKSASEKAVDKVANGIGDIQISDWGYYRLFDVGGGGRMAVVEGRKERERWWKVEDNEK